MRVAGGDLSAAGGEAPTEPGGETAVPYDVPVSPPRFDAIREVFLSLYCHCPNWVRGRNTVPRRGRRPRRPAAHPVFGGAFCSATNTIYIHLNETSRRPRRPNHSTDGDPSVAGRRGCGSPVATSPPQAEKHRPSREARASAPTTYPSRRLGLTQYGRIIVVVLPLSELCAGVEHAAS